MIAIIAISFVGLYLIVYLGYMYLCYAEETHIRRLEEDFQIHTDHWFHLTVFKLMTTYNLLNRFVDIDTMMEDACKLYNNDSKFRVLCYKNGIKPRMLEYIKSHSKVGVVIHSSASSE